jgi:hypothetical protein
VHLQYYLVSLEHNAARSLHDLDGSFPEVLLFVLGEEVKLEQIHGRNIVRARRSPTTIFEVNQLWGSTLFPSVRTHP